ncbi:MAG: protein-disulfide reductase DsbD family protein [Sphingomonadaceae bacterium]
MRPFARYRHVIAALLQFVLLVALTAPARAAETNIAARLIAEGPAPAGGEVMVAIHMDPKPGWHGYWSNPGDAGLGMQLDWTLPPGAKAGEMQYPVPTTLLISGLMNHVYKGDYAVLVPLTLPAMAKAGERLPVSVDAQWLACTDEVCVPERAQLETVLEVGNPRQTAQFDAWRARLPAPLDSQGTFALTGKTLRLAIPLPAAMALDNPHLFIGEDKVAAYAEAQRISRNGDRLVVELARPKYAPAEPEQITGVLRLNAAGDGLAFEAVPGAVPANGEPISAEAAPAMGLGLLLLAALAGGLLLNVMPCVFPILSLKALSLARAGESEAQARAEGLAYTAGVIVATVALGALLLALRAAGEQVGWAFQLQEPLVVALLLVLAAAITANFIGLFEVPMPSLSRAGSRQGAFATGLLAAFVATPCTGPFMAAAMGAALLLPVGPALLLFAALGLGLALPFLAVAFVPRLRQRLPKPGPWMERFRRWMALPMALTAGALVWLAWRVGGTAFAIAATGLALLVVLVLAVMGRRQKAGTRSALPALAVIAALLISGALLLPRLQSTTAAPAAQGLIVSSPYSAAELAKARGTGQPVFAWFTADWCITCKVNEQVAIEREATKAAFEKAGVIVLRGDWTRRDPEITRYLTEQGAAGVPLYVWYPADGSAPQVLPQVLTPDTLVDLAAGESSK